MVDAGEADVGDFIEGEQMLHDDFAHVAGGDLARALLLDVAFDFLEQRAELGFGVRTFLERLLEARDHLVASVAFTAAVALHDRDVEKLSLFSRRKPKTTTRSLAFTAASNAHSVGRKARVDDARALKVTNRTVHIEKEAFSLFILHHFSSDEGWDAQVFIVSGWLLCLRCGATLWLLVL